MRNTTTSMTNIKTSTTTKNTQLLTYISIGKKLIVLILMLLHLLIYFILVSSGFSSKFTNLYI